MMLDAGMIFDNNATRFSLEAGTPKSAEAFRERYITPAYARSYEEGTAIEEAYGDAIRDYQRDGFIVGFRAVILLLMNGIQCETARM